MKPITGKAAIVQTTSMRKAALSSEIMKFGTDRLAQTRFENAMALFDEFVRSNVKHADAATLRGLESRFATRLQIQPSYWSQIKGRSRQIGERLARQFEQLCRKPAGWMDEAHGQGDAVRPTTDFARTDSVSSGGPLPKVSGAGVPLDDDERFIVGLVLTYYRRHPQRARARLLDLLGEVLAPPVSSSTSTAVPSQSTAQKKEVGQPPADDAAILWARAQASVAPLKRKR